MELTLKDLDDTNMSFLLKGILSTEDLMTTLGSHWVPLFKGIYIHPGLKAVVNIGYHARYVFDMLVISPLSDTSLCPKQYYLPNMFSKEDFINGNLPPELVVLNTVLRDRGWRLHPEMRKEVSVYVNLRQMGFFQMTLWKLSDEYGHYRYAPYHYWITAKETANNLYEPAYVLPILPNIYTSGAVCQGPTDLETDNGHDPLLTLMYYIQQFERSAWREDLLPVSNSVLSFWCFEPRLDGPPVWVPPVTRATEYKARMVLYERLLELPRYENISDLEEVEPPPPILDRKQADRLVKHYCGVLGAVLQ